jgi:PRTRC genetic system ThiF family protein
MQIVDFEKTTPFRLGGSTTDVTIALVGCGGTGSHLASDLARLAYHCRETAGIQVDLVFIDGDTVEQKNVGRQLFAEHEIGKNKAQVLAGRFSAAFGLMIDAVPEMADSALLHQIAAHQRGQHWQTPPTGILVGAVDNAAGRRALAQALDAGLFWRAWIDSGNQEQSGQVMVGTTGDLEKLHGTLKMVYSCTHLPAPGMVAPELLEDAPAPEIEAAVDCALAMQRNMQALMINRMMASIAAEYVTSLVLHRQIDIMETVVSLTNGTMYSTAITPSSLSHATGLTKDQLRGTELSDAHACAV